MYQETWLNSPQVTTLKERFWNVRDNQDSTKDFFVELISEHVTMPQSSYGVVAAVLKTVL